MRSSWPWFFNVSSRLCYFREPAFLIPRDSAYHHSRATIGFLSVPNTPEGAQVAATLSTFASLGSIIVGVFSIWRHQANTTTADSVRLRRPVVAIYLTLTLVSHSIHTCITFNIATLVCTGTPSCLVSHRHCWCGPSFSSPSPLLFSLWTALETTPRPGVKSLFGQCWPYSSCFWLLSPLPCIPFLLYGSSRDVRQEYGASSVLSGLDRRSQ